MCRPRHDDKKLDPSEKEVSICAVGRAPEKFVGARVQLRGRYKTDNAHYEYLIDSKCGGTPLSISNIDLVPSETVKKFYEVSEKKCEEKRSKYLCILEAEMHATVKVVLLENGRPGIDLLNIDSFTFVQGAE